MDIRAGLRKLHELRKNLEDGSAIEEPYASALATQARRIGAGHPTPQARMVSEAIVVHGAELSVPASAVISPRVGPSLRAGEVAGGAEYGSSIYPQFGPRRSTGAFLEAAARAPDSATVKAGEDALERLVREAVR